MGLLVVGSFLLLLGGRLVFWPGPTIRDGLEPTAESSAAIRSNIRRAGEGERTIGLPPPRPPDGAVSLKVGEDSATLPGKPTILTEKIPLGVVGEAYSQALKASGVNGPAVWILAAGELPPKISLTPAGVISGYPDQAGEWWFTVRVAGADGGGTAKKLRLLILAASEEMDGLRIVTEELPKALLGRNYLHQLTAEGGLPPYLWYIEMGEPPESLRLNPDSGALIGIPRQVGDFQFTVRATDEEEDTAFRGYRLQVEEGGIEIVTGSLPPAVRGENYRLTLRARGGAVPYFWELVSGGLPQGLRLDRDRGIIAGLPPNLEATSFLIRVADREGRSAEKEFELLVTTEYDRAVGGGGLRIVTENLPDATRGRLYSSPLKAVGGEPPYIWTICRNDLPPDLWLDAESGEVVGIPERIGTSDFTVMVNDAQRRAVRRDFSLNVAPQLVYIITGNLKPAVIDQGYEVQIEATGGTPPYFFSLVLGALPAGLGLDSDGWLSGKIQDDYSGPDPQEFVFRIRAEDRAENYDIAEFRLTVQDAEAELTISTKELPRGGVDAEYWAALEAAGGTKPYSWSSINLPQGLVSSPEGVISGIPARTETCIVEVTVTDREELTAKAELELSVGQVSGVQRVISAPGDAKVGLAWQNPGSGDFSGVKVVRKRGTYPETAQDGEPVYEGTGDNIVDDKGLINGITYCYAVVAYDQDKNPAKIDENARTSVIPLEVNLSGPYDPYADRVVGFYPLSGSGSGPTWTIGRTIHGSNDEIRNSVVALRQGGTADPPGTYIQLEGGARGKIRSGDSGGYRAEGLGSLIDGTFDLRSGLEFNGKSVYRNSGGYYLFWATYFEEDTSRTSRALGAPTGRGIYQGSISVVSLQAKSNDGSPPCGGTIILRFTDNIVIDGPGPDFTVFENVFYINGDETRRFMEPAVVAVSQDGDIWREFPFDYRPSYTSTGEINFSNPYSYNSGRDGWSGFAGINPTFSNNGYPDPTDPAVSGGDSYDLSKLPGRPWTWIQYVKITSTGDRWLRGTSGTLVRHTAETGALSGVGSSGFDLDAVCAINY